MNPKLMIPASLLVLLGACGAAGAAVRAVQAPTTTQEAPETTMAPTTTVEPTTEAPTTTAAPIGDKDDGVVDDHETTLVVALLVKNGYPTVASVVTPEFLQKLADGSCPLVKTPGATMKVWQLTTVSAVLPLMDDLAKYGKDMKWVGTVLGLATDDACGTLFEAMLGDGTGS